MPLTHAHTHRESLACIYTDLRTYIVWILRKYLDSVLPFICHFSIIWRVKFVFLRRQIYMHSQLYICNFCVINLMFLEMFQREDQFSYKQQDADWSRETRGKKLIQTINLGNWVLLHTQRDSNIANDFKQTLQRVCGPMGMNVNEPVMYVFLISLNGDLWHMHNNNSGSGLT